MKGSCYSKSAMTWDEKVEEAPKYSKPQIVAQHLDAMILGI